MIPPYAEMKGTIRALDAKKMDELKNRVKSVAEHVALSFNQNATVIFDSISYPPTINDQELFTWTHKVRISQSGSPMRKFVQETWSVDVKLFCAIQFKPDGN